MKQEDVAALAKTYYEKMRANYHSTENPKITPENVFQEGIRHNYALFMELVCQRRRAPFENPFFSGREEIRALSDETFG